VRQTALKLVTETTWRDEQFTAEQVSFCSHCAARATKPDRRTRVCGFCSLGVMLEASAEIAPAVDDAFLVVDRAMSILAVSRGAEALLETTEVQAVHRHLTELLHPPDTEAGNRSSLAFAISSAVSGSPIDKPFTLRPANLFGVRLGARIGSCGPRPGALVILGR
jgi:PAS domain-containing protein